ncbi:MAG: serine hydrolase domain-containing protein [Pseudomonadales bacterium]
MRSSAGRWLVILLLPGLLPGLAAATPPASGYRLPGGAADYADPYVAAGFRALFTCSAHFLMNRPLDDILEVELADTTPLNLPTPEIDTARRLVRAEDGRGDTVVAVFRDSMGCSLLPPDWSIGDAAHLPHASIPQRANDPEVDYPLGDRAVPRPTAAQRALLERAFDGASFGTDTLTAGVLIIHKGRIVGERYRQGFGIHQGYRTWSTAKSLSATLIAIAAGDGLIDLDAPVGLEAWSGPADPRAAITWKQLLWMSSGLWSRGSNSYAVYFAGQDAASAATSTPLEAGPGKRWQYANSDTLLLLLGLRQVLDDDLAYLRFPYDRLLHRIGMYHTWMETDHAGNFIGSSQIYTTARDLGRFALLYLQNGVWAGERLLPQGWTTFAASPAPAFERTAGERGYGAQFWLFDGVAGLPAGTYTTAGNKGQYATIVPEADLVVVRTGVDPVGAGWDQPRFVRAVINTFVN